MHFHKYHALANDYLVLDPRDHPDGTAVGLTPAWVRCVCDRHQGIGADGVVEGPLKAEGDAAVTAFVCRIWNPDGSVAETSGNGLRIFARYLMDSGYVKTPPTQSWSIHVGARSYKVRANAGLEMEIEMGRATVPAAAVELPPDVLAALGAPTLVDIGNPHCVFILPADFTLNPQLACHWGPMIECAPAFAQRTNVQFVQVVDRQHLRLEIWERGAGYTRASGSSSCAAAVAAVDRGRCTSPLVLEMAGGIVQVTVTQTDDGYQVSLAGPVSPVMRGVYHPQWLSILHRTDVRTAS